MIIIAGTIAFDSSKRSTLDDAFETMRAATLQEAGCHEYQCYVSRTDPGTAFFFEKWEDDDALPATCSRRTWPSSARRSARSASRASTSRSTRARPKARCTDSLARPALAEHIVFLCTGNAARSVMATIMFRARTDRHSVSGSGTHVLPGHPMSVRTRTASSRLGLADPTHRSAQFDETDVRRAALIVAMAPEHVQWVRRVHPEAADRTVTLKRSCVR